MWKKLAYRNQPCHSVASMYYYRAVCAFGGIMDKENEAKRAEN